MTLVTIPSKRRLWEAQLMTPAYMRPNALPTAAYLEGYLSERQCDAIVDTYNAEEPYHFGGCEAITRECPRPLSVVLDPIDSFGEVMNDLFWKFDLDKEPAAWMQTYETGNKYALHTDGAPGQMRKLTAVAFLTDQNAYEGGHLWVKIEPRSHVIPKTRGTVVVFPSWVPHYVDPVTAGKRQTINLGYWGPNFR